MKNLPCGGHADEMKSLELQLAPMIKEWPDMKAKVDHLVLFKERATGWILAAAFFGNAAISLVGKLWK